MKSIYIEENYKFYGHCILSSRQPLYLPMLNGLVYNPVTNIEDTSTEIFLVDTGASITILRPKFTSLFSPINQIDYQYVQYGNNVVKLPVYEIGLKIKGYDFKIYAAIDNNLNMKHSLLGHYNFFQSFDFIINNSKKKNMKLIAK